MNLPSYQYQLVVMGPNADRYDGSLRAVVEQGLREIGLDPKTSLTTLQGDQATAIDVKGCLAGIWFGGEGTFPNESAHLVSARTLLDLGGTVIPLVETLDRFPALIPAPLRHLNGIRWDDARIPGDILKALGLSRDLRRAFISYKRSDSEGIARQLAHTLFDRGYQVFLDTASVERSARFQSVLHDRLSDIDLVVLLDSPHALESVWVHEELDLIHQLGLGVLQLAWVLPDPDDPARRVLRATRGTEFSVRFPLEVSHFVDPGVMLGPKALLQEEALAQVADRAEQARIRSLGARRARVVSYLRAEAGRLDLEVEVLPGGPVTLRRGKKTLARVYPIVGLPDAWLINEFERKIAARWKGPKARAGSAAPPARGSSRRLKNDWIVYDGLGIIEERLSHLNWLNESLRPRSLRTELLSDWLKSHGQGSGLPVGERPGA